jgi:DNA-binding CsgD family transcriptional regulator
MRVLLVGRSRDRDRVRAELVDAGIDIVGEADRPPAPGSASQRFDAIVTATPLPSGGLGSGGVTSRGTDLNEYVETLTAREHDVLGLLAQGLPNKAIADSLGISDQTVKFHVAAVIRKLGAVNRTDAVRRAIRRGLVAL